MKRSALESCVKGWGVSVLVGWTDVSDFSARPIQLIAGKTWKGSLFGGNLIFTYIKQGLTNGNRFKFSH